MVVRFATRGIFYDTYMFTPGRIDGNDVLPSRSLGRRLNISIDMLLDPSLGYD